MSQSTIQFGLLFGFPKQKAGILKERHAQVELGNATNVYILPFPAFLLRPRSTPARLRASTEDRWTYRLAFCPTLTSFDVFFLGLSQHIDSNLLLLGLSSSERLQLKQKTLRLAPRQLATRKCQKGVTEQTTRMVSLGEQRRATERRCELGCRRR